MRLPTVLMLMALVLAAGVLGVQQLESRVGGTSVPGVIVLDVPSLDMAAAQDLTRRHEGARIDWIAADAEPMSPFDIEATHRFAGRGEATVLFDPAGQGATDWRAGWSVVLDVFPEADAAGRAARAGARAADFVRAQTGTRPFRVGLALGEAAETDVEDLLALLLAAADALPSIRRTSIVVLGERMPGSPRRLSVRLDRGKWGSRARPALGDLLEDAP